jgi:hypothetical protein
MAFAERYLRFLLLLTSLGSVGSVTSVRAQNSTSGRSVEVRFTVFSEGLLQGLSFIPKPREAPVELQFMSTQRSRLYEYYGSNSIEFSTDVHVPPDPARPGLLRTDRIVVARAVIPSGVREALLLFSLEPGWENQPVPRYVVQVFDDSRTAVPLDHLAFLNATGLPLFGTVGEREVQLSAGISRALRVAAGETPVLLHVLHENQVLPVYGDLIALERNQRVLVVLFPPIGPDATHVRRRLLYDPDHPPYIRRPRETTGG